MKVTIKSDGQLIAARGDVRLGSASKEPYLKLENGYWLHLPTGDLGMGTILDPEVYKIDEIILVKKS